MSVLHRVRPHGVGGELVYLLEASGSPVDLVGQNARSYASQLTGAELAELAERVNGVSVDKWLLLRSNSAGNTLGLTTFVSHVVSCPFLVVAGAKH